MTKFVRTGVCALAALMLLAGCSKNKTQDTTETKETQATESDAEEYKPEDFGTVTLGKYKGVEVKAQSVEVTDKDVDDYIASQLKSNPDITEVDRAAANGDVVNIDYVGLKDGVPFDGGTAEGYDLTLGSNSFIDGFESGLVGAKKGDEVSLNLTFPENYGSKDLAGKAVVFDVTVNAVKEKKDAVLDDAFAQKMSADYKTVEDYKKGTKETLIKNKENQAKYTKQSEALEKIYEDSKFDLKQDLLDKEYQKQYNDTITSLQAYGMDLDSYAAMMGTDKAGFEGQLRTSIENGIKMELVVAAVAKAENIKVEDADREELAKMNEVESAQKLIDTYGQDKVDQTALRLKVINYIADNAVEK